MMKRTVWTMTMAVAVLMFAACGGGNAKKNTAGQGQTKTEATKSKEDSKMERVIASFKQFGIDYKEVEVTGIEGGRTLNGGAVKDPLTYGARANYTLLQITPTAEQTAAYVEKLYNLVKAASDDGKVHGSKTNGRYDTVLTLEEARKDWNWGYMYKGKYIDVYPSVGKDKLGIGMNYASQ